MALRPEKNSPANQALVDRWDDLPIDLPYGPEEFIDMIDSWEIIALIGVPDGADLGILAMFVNAIRTMHDGRAPCRLCASCWTPGWYRWSCARPPGMTAA